uniref:Dinoflagellate viral nucleoprotein DVNP.4 n=1 Tax=Hematodinium sp. SG-2012 TaxID=1263730 RepID=K9NVB1_9DINO|nr:dinoflagellate viral nucleoprotein DVNP.4 [Hematodinium sp. SG-2012]|eukprot:GEMP01093123.1.p1 GENE.GEMP01093123.1~~GEMP01093123.1.p1  ORF type:complete len:130 (+),score=31.61 GEMP01093123.1:31-420(+)
MAKKAMRKKGGMKKSAKPKGGKKKGMKKKRVSKVAKGKRAKSSVFRGTKEKTSGGLKRSDLCRNKRGKVVSKKASEAAKKRFKKSGLGRFAEALQKARKALGIKGFQAIGGKTAKGQALLKKTRELARR